MGEVVGAAWEGWRQGRMELEMRTDGDGDKDWWRWGQGLVETRTRTDQCLQVQIRTAEVGWDEFPPPQSRCFQDYEREALTAPQTAEVDAEFAG